MKSDFDISFIDQTGKVVQFFADKAIVLLSYLILGATVIDSFIKQLPNGHGAVQCIVKNYSVTSGQQAYLNKYCADNVPWETYELPSLIFTQGLLAVLLHFSWYSMVLYAHNVHNLDSGKTREVNVSPSSIDQQDPNRTIASNAIEMN